MNSSARSLFSLGIVALFVALALGSSGSTPFEMTTYHGNGNYRQQTRYVDDEGNTTDFGPTLEGPKDQEGRWQGKVKIYKHTWEVETDTYNIQEFDRGQRHGFGGHYVQGKLTQTEYYENDRLLAIEKLQTDPATGTEYWERSFYNPGGYAVGEPTRIPRPREPRRLADVVRAALVENGQDHVPSRAEELGTLELTPAQQAFCAAHRSLAPPRAALPDPRAALTPDAIQRALSGQAPWFIPALEAANITPAEWADFLRALASELTARAPGGDTFNEALDDSLEAVAATSARRSFVNQIYRNVRAAEMIEAAKSSAPRLALLKRLRAGAGTTFDIIRTDFPGALADWQAAGVQLADVQRFFAEVDRRCDAQPPLDGNDPLFWHQVDALLTNTLGAMQREQFDFGTALQIPLLEYANLRRTHDPLLRAAHTAYFAAAPLDRTALAWQVAEIYIATLMYAPDSEGLHYWIDEIAAGKGWTATTVAQSFFDQPGVRALYPAGQPDDVFVDTLYRHLFDRAPDAAGKVYWLAELASGRVARNAMVIALINGGWANPEAAADMARFRHRIEVGLFFAGQQAWRGIVFSALSLERQARLRALGEDVLATVTADPTTRDAACAAIPGWLETL